MSIDTDYATLREVLALKPEGWAVEFGVYSGYSLALIAQQMPVIGFDSFEGLPEDWREGFPKGTFDDARLRDGGVLGPNRLIIPGWFSDTVSGFPFPDLSLVHIDCDLYSSTVTALEGVASRMGPGTYVVFDEFHGYEGAEVHEAQAWREFCDKYHVVFETAAYGEQERAFRIESIDGRH